MHHTITFCCGIYYTHFIIPWEIRNFQDTRTQLATDQVRVTRHSQSAYREKFIKLDTNVIEVLVKSEGILSALIRKGTLSVLEVFIAHCGIGLTNNAKTMWQ